MSSAAALHGDPASISALAATMRTASLRLAAEAERVGRALDDAEPGWTGRAALEQRRRSRAAAQTLARAAETLRQSAQTLQEGATELAEPLAELQRIEERAAEHGLAVRDGMVSTTWGITGVVADDAPSGEAVRAQLEQRLHAAASALGRTRARVTRDCLAARRTLEGLRATA